MLRTIALAMALVFATSGAQSRAVSSFSARPSISVSRPSVPSIPRAAPAPSPAPKPAPVYTPKPSTPSTPSTYSTTPKTSSSSSSWLPAWFMLWMGMDAVEDAIERDDD